MTGIDEIGMLKRILRSSYRPSPNIMELWRQGVIHPSTWGTVLIGTGDITVEASDTPFVYAHLVGAAAGDVATLYGFEPWFCAPNLAGVEATFGVQTIFRSLHLEFEAKFTTPDLFEPYGGAGALFGWGSGVNAVSNSNNIIGIVVQDDGDLRYTTDRVGTETSAPLIDAAAAVAWHKYKISAFPGVVSFYVDDELIGSNTGDTILPETAMYPIFNLIQQGAGAIEFDLGMLRIWMEDTD